MTPEAPAKNIRIGGYRADTALDGWVDRISTVHLLLPEPLVHRCGADAMRELT
jgi:hypothetical protein